MSYFGLDKKENKENINDEEAKGLKEDEKEDKEKQEGKEGDKNAGGDKRAPDMNQQHEDDLNDKLDDVDDQRKADTIIQRIEYDMRNTAKEVRLKVGDKINMEKLRRWELKIFNVYITPLREMVDPFVQFTVGGDYSVQVFSNKSGQSYKVPKGERGFADKTEVLKNVDALERRPFDKIILSEIRMSYSMINNQKLMIELWDYNTIWMNKIMGYCTIDLIDVVNGNMNQQVEIKKKEAKKKRPKIQALIEFKCLFQEIWDYSISFLNFKVENTLSTRQQKSSKVKAPNLQVSIEVEGSKIIDMYKHTKSEVVSSCSNPQFSNFDDVIVFRGTYSSLEAQNLVFKLISHTALFSNVLSVKTVNLQGIFEFERIKSDFALVDEQSNEKYNSKFEASVKIETDTRYQQKGDNTTLYSTKKYLCINIMRIENIRPAETRGIVDSFVSVEYTGISQRTRTIKENNNPIFNETLFFMVPIKEDLLKDIPRNAQKINEQFAKNNEVVFNLMIEGDDNTYDNLGIANFHLSDLKTAGIVQQRKYFADDLKKDKRYMSRIYTGKIKLVSAFSLSNNTYINFEAWFLDDFPDLIDFGEKKSLKEMGDKIPVELSYALKNTKDTDEFYDKYKKRIAEVFRQYVNYSFKERCFFEVYQMDQYKNVHLVPYYLSAISLPLKNFTKTDRENNPFFHDYNLTTLDEIAHFVRCFPINLDSKGDVWSSPDYVVKVRKGGLEDHAILMACLMLGLKKIKKITLEELEGDLNNSTKNPISEKEGAITSKTKTTNTETTKGNTAKGGTTVGQTPMQVETTIAEVFPYENRVFVCVGKLKFQKQRHTWVMTIGDDYRDITFWDPKMFYKFNLYGRVLEPDKLRNFLMGKYLDYESIKAGVAVNAEEEDDIDESHESIKQDKSDYEDKILPLLNDSAIVRYEDEKLYKDNILNENEILIQNYGVTNDNAKTNFLKQALNFQVDDQIIIANSDEPNKKKVNFLEEEKKKMEEELNSDNDRFFLPIDEFKDRSGKTVGHTCMPYETIDIIFNRNNIFANKQYHDPADIRYNLYENTEWIPYCILKENKIWRNKFDSFYSMTNFGPVLSPNLVSKMSNALVKEVRVGIAAARSGMNLQTKFKKKNENINLFLRKFLDNLEDIALNRITERQFKINKLDWKDMIKTKMPKFYRMEAKTLFYNFYELEIIRRNMTEDIETFFASKIKNLMFATSAKVYPYLNQAVSVRIILAKFFRIEEEDISPEDLAEYKHDLLMRDQPIKEEEDSFDENEEEKEGTPDGATLSPDGETNKGETTAKGKEESKDAKKPKADTKTPTQKETKTPK